MNEKKSELQVELRKWKISDARALADILCSKKVQDNLRDGLPFPYTEQDGKDYISAMLSASERDTFAFAVTANGEVVGCISAFRGTNIHGKTAEIGYYVAEKYWDKGVATEAIKLICDYVFSRSDILRVYAEPFAENIGSCRALEKAGFTCEGTLRANAVKNGKVLDMKIFARLRG